MENKRGGVSEREGKGMEMDAETRSRVEKTVLGILEEANMSEMTLSKVRSLASERLGIDLSGSSETKMFVREIVDNFLFSRPAQVEEEGGTAADEEEVEEESVDRKKRTRLTQDDNEEDVVEEKEEDDGDGGDDDVDGNGDPILCRLSNKRRVTLQEFRGMTLVSIREYYMKDGKEFPTSRGISLTNEQWDALRNAVPVIERAMRKRARN